MVSVRTFAHRDMAQLGSALRSGRRGRRFKSCYPDHMQTHIMAEVMWVFPCNLSWFISPDACACIGKPRTHLILLPIIWWIGAQLFRMAVAVEH